MFTLTVIGKYGPFPKAGGATSSYLLTMGDKRVLIDMGSGTLTKLMADYDIKDIDAVIFTHLHGDHMADALVFQYSLQVKQLKPVDVFLPAEPENEHALIEGSANFNANTIDESQPLHLFGAEISFKKTIHPVACYAVKVVFDGKTFVFSGDTVYDPGISAFADGCDVFLCDSAVTEPNHPDKLPHPSARQAAMMAKEAGVKRLLLTHISPLSDETEIYLEAKEVFDLCVVVEEGKTYYI